MSSKTIVILLMLSCLSATGAALGLTERAPQEGGGQAVPTIIDLVIKEVHWLMEETSTTVHVCTEEVLPDGVPKLVYRYGIPENTTTTEGVVDTADLHCATFTKDAKYKIDENPARYELIVTDTIVPPSVVIGHGITTLVITVIPTILTCGSSKITKVTWSGSEVLSDPFPCIDGTADSDKTCYHEGDITGTELCFVVKDAKELDVTVCLNGPIFNSPISTALISSNYFSYGLETVSKVATDAKLSLTMVPVGVTNMRAIVREAEDPQSPDAPRVAQVYGCLAGVCTFPAYERKLATYEVCLDEMDDSLATLETATITLTDLDLYAFDAGFQKSKLLLECVFANGLPDRKYTARLLGTLPEASVADEPLSASSIDCTGVTINHACFGYLDADSDADVLYVAVSAADADYSNTIIAPFTMP